MDMGLAKCPALLLKTWPVPQPALSPSPPASRGFGGTGSGVVMHGRVRLSQSIAGPSQV